ncbi:MAG: FAD-binding protein [Hyphomicrobiaceae bacterium]|nr:FAD-binding protein [Hyphomicrobiaceae bacterium]
MTSLAILEPNAEVLNHRDRLIRGLRDLLSTDRVVADEDGRRAFETDALTAYKQMPLAAVLPTTTEEVSRVLRYCKANDIKVIARGAGTSLCGGALPSEDSIVLGVSKMNRVLDIDYMNRTATVQTGITNIGISNIVSPNGFFYAPDPSSQLACTLAGNLGMNSGGAHCLKYGVTTNNVLGLKIVLMDGEIVEIGGKELDAAGYDLLGLIIGSEGQFGIVTEATVRILRAAEGARPMLMGFNSSEAAGACVAAIIGSGIIPVAIEFMDKPAIHVCEEFAKAGYPLDVEALLIVEVEGSEEEIESLLGRISDIAKPFKPKGIRVSQSEAESKAIWLGRKSAFGAIGRISDYYCMDGTIPLGKLPEVLVEIGEICARYKLNVANIFHAGDGNLHPLILYNANDPAEVERAEKCGAEVLELCVKVGGCLTGEHGVGVEKRELMLTQFSKTDLEQQMRIKTVFDPDWLLNREKVFPLELHAP